MKHFFKLTILASVVTALIFGLSAFKTKQASNTDAYSIELMSSAPDVSRGSHDWVWVLSNPNPGNGDNGTLQDVSHVSIPLSAQAEAALTSAEYSYDGITWTSVAISMDRDPAIKQCTSTDVLKFDVGTTGSAPLYFRLGLAEEFAVNPYANCYIKTGGGRNGCNSYYFAGIGGTRVD